LIGRTLANFAYFDNTALLVAASQHYHMIKMSMCIAKVLGGVSLKQTVKVAKPFLKFDDFLNYHFRENEEFLVHDPEEKGKVGDWVLVKTLPEPLSLQVRHELLKVIYKNGDMIDPVTGKKCVGTEFLEDVEWESQVFGWKPLTERDIKEIKDK